MNARQRQRAGQAVAARMAELAVTPTTVSRAAGISTKTLRALVRGERWPTEAVQLRVEQVLRWPSGEIATRAVTGRGGVLDGVADVDLAAELLRRLEAQQRRRHVARRAPRETARPT